ncbi:MAG: IclR family transcriptional regulator [Bryobacteraceae bacterium]
MPSEPSIVPAQRRRRPKRGASSSTPKEDAGSQYHQRAISRALDVLEGFSDEHPELTLKEMSQRIDLPESSLFRILLTLESRGYLVQSADGAYTLAPKLLLGRLQERAEQVRVVLRPHLQQLAGRFDETASSAYLFENRIEALDSVETFHAIRMTNKPGRVLSPHASSLGKVITAFQKPELIDRMIEVYGLVPRTPRTVTDRQALLAEFERIRAQGYALDREESVMGGVCIGAAIAIDNNSVMAGLSVSTPVVRMTPEKELEITRAVLDAARRAALDLKSSRH